MPCVQEFGILDRVDPARDYGDSYTPEQYGCVAIDDDYLNDWWPRWAELPSYFHCLARPGKGLARYGVTLLPPSSLPTLRDMVCSDPRYGQDPALEALADVLARAAREEKFVIHYGV